MINIFPALKHEIKSIKVSGRKYVLEHGRPGIIFAV
jgi:hypothetical protein